MPSIDIKVFARLHEVTMRKTKRDFHRSVTEMAQMLPDELTKGMHRAAPKVRRQMLSAADAAGAYTKRTQDLKKAQEERNRVLEDAASLEHAATAEMARGAKVADDLTEIEKERTKALRAQKTQLRAVEAREKNLSDKKAEHAKTTAKLREENLKLKRIKDDEGAAAAKAFRQRQAYRDLDQQNAAEIAWIQKKTLELADANDELTRRTEALNDVKRRQNELNSELGESAKSLKRYEDDLQKSRQRAADLDDEIIRQNDEVIRSNRRREESLRRLSEAEAEPEKKRKRGNFSRSVSNGTAAAGNILTDLPFVPSGPAGAAIGAPLVSAMILVAEQVVTASQAIALLPAVLAAAGAGFGTLALATAGFGDALKDMGDPEKFAEALQGMAPSAQQAALEIQALVQGPLGALKSVTQEAFFSGVPEEIRQLVNTFLPSIQTLTTGIATSFNSMFKGIGDQLMSPDTQGQLQNTFDNIGAFFQNLVGAAPALTDAFTTLISAGSDFLPGIGQGLAEAAQSFADFIAQAQQSGQLQVWIQEGIDAVKGLASAIWEITVLIYDLFGHQTKEDVQAFVDGIKDIATVMSGDLSPILNGFIDDLNLVGPRLAEIANAAGMMANTFVQAFVNGPIKVVNHLLDLFNKIPSTVRGMFGLPTGDLQIPEIPEFQGATWNNIPHVGGRNETPINMPPIPGSGLHWEDGKGWVPDKPDPLRLPGLDLGPSPFRPVPQPTPKDADGSKITDAERRDRLRASLNPNDFMPSLGAIPPGPAPGSSAAPPIGASGPGGYNVDPRAVADAQYKLEQEARDVRDARMDLAVLERDALSTEEELLHAREKLADETHQFNNAQLDLQEAQLGKWKKANDSMSDSMGKLGAGLDRDLGISKGLAGLADNLVRFLANLATAPLQGMLQRIIDANPNEGSGLIGIMAAQGAFGPEWTPQGIAASQNGYSTGGSTTLGGTASGLPAFSSTIGMPSNLSDTGSVPSGPQSRYAAAMIQQLFPEVRGQIGGSRDTNTAPNTHDAGLSIDIPIDPDQMELGDRINAWLQQNAAQLGLEYSIWRDKGTYPGGGGFTAGGHQDHIDAHFNGAGGSGAPTMPMAGMPSFGSSASFGGGGSIPLPLPVYIVGGGATGSVPGVPAAGGGNTMGFPAMPPGLGTQINPGQGAEGWRQTVASVIAQYGPQMGINPSQYKIWEDAIVRQIDTESKGDPNAYNGNDSNGQGGTQTVQGLLQYLPSTYAATGGKLTGRPYLDPVGQIAGALFAKRNPDGTPILGNGTGWSPNTNTPMLPSAITGGRGESPILGAGGSGYQPTVQPQAPQGWQPGAKSSGGGIAGAGLSAAAGMFPGGGAAAQIAMQMIQRTIQYGGEVAGSLAQGALDFFSVSDPDGGPGASLNESWLGRLAGSIASAAPALPSTAGSADRATDQGRQQQMQQPNAAAQATGNKPGAPLIGTMNVQADKLEGQRMAGQLAYASYAAGLPR